MLIRSLIWTPTAGLEFAAAVLHHQTMTVTTTSER